MYRAVGWKALHDGLALDDEAAMAAMAEHANLVVEAGVVAVDGHDVTQAIRTPEMDKTAAAVARLPRVRAALVARQRALGAQGGVVMEGRDIGTVVFPDAPSDLPRRIGQERARRRANDAPAGMQPGGGRRRARRDQSDSTRTASPLTVAKDAVVIDTTDVPIERWSRRC
jgi:cytidylate kinase